MRRSESRARSRSDTSPGLAHARCNRCVSGVVGANSSTSRARCTVNFGNIRGSTPRVFKNAPLLRLAEQARELAHVQLRRPPRRPSRTVEGRQARRLRRPADRRAYERICRELRPAARLADRFSGLGRVGGGAARAGRDLRRRALHAPGPQPGQRRPMELPVGARDEHDRLAEGACARGRADRLRPLASHPRLGEEGQGSARQPRRRAGAGRQEPDRRDLERSPRSLEGAPRRPVRPICGQVGGREADRDRRLAGQASCRRGGALGARIRSPGRSTSAAPT